MHMLLLLRTVCAIQYALPKSRYFVWEVCGSSIVGHAQACEPLAAISSRQQWTRFETDYGKWWILFVHFRPIKLLFNSAAVSVVSVRDECGTVVVLQKVSLHIVSATFRLTNAKAC